MAARARTGPWIGWTAAALCLGTWATLRWLYPAPPELVPYVMSGHWVRPADPAAGAAQFRMALDLTGQVRSAWVAVSAWQGFELSVNGTVVGRAPLSRPTRPFQFELSARGQQVARLEGAVNLIFPREYQWTGNSSHELPVFFDLGPYLMNGRNAICVEVEAQEAPARLALEGDIQLWSGERLPLDSRGFATPPEPAGRGWTEAGFRDLDWVPAIPAEAPPGRPLRVLDPAVFREPFAGRWLRAAVPGNDAVWFETTWRLEHKPKEAWVRLLVNRQFELFVNGVPVRVLDARPYDQDAGEWVIGRRRFSDVPATPEALQAEDVGSLFGSTRFDAPPPDDGDSPPPRAPRGIESLLDGQDEARSESDARQPGRPWNAGSDRAALTRPEPFEPKELARKNAGTGLHAYAIERLLAAGDNTVAVRLAPPDAGETALWPAALAADGRATFEDGAGTPFLAAEGWRTRHQAADGASSAWSAAAAGELAAAPGTTLPRLNYRGPALPSRSTRAWQLAASLLFTALAIGLILILPAAFARARRGAIRARGAPVEPLAAPRLVEAPWPLIPPTLFLFAVLLVDLSWAERSDRLLLSSRGAWGAVIGIALLAAAATGAATGTGWRPAPRALLATLARWRPPGRAGWRVGVGAVLLACAFLRGHDLAGQSFENDELASAQAALAIAQVGVPRYSEDVYYSRSPLYHYLVGAFVKFFGPSFWALRLPTVLFATATALLIYLAGARLLGSRWVGLASAALYAVHPYAIFVGHMTRFYQQQQFFCLLTVYFFCRGFVTGESRRFRLLTVASFVAACLSQELSVVMAVPLLVAAPLFTRRIDRRSMLELLAASGCAGVLVALDILVFQTRCLTRLEGISPNVEATVHLHFASPMNVLTLFLGYSRLHLALSLLLVAGLPFLLRSRDRNGLAMAMVLVGGVLGTMLLVTHEAPRYQYWLFSIWILLGVHSAAALARGLARRVAGGAGSERWIRPGLTALLLGAVLLGWSPWRIAGSYGSRILGDPSSAFGYVRAHMRPGDAVAATEPHPPEGLMDLGRIDYDLSVPLLHDYVQRRNGRLVDRNGNAEVIATLDQLQNVLAHRDRLWVLVSRERFRSRGQGIRWEFPGARFELFLRENLKVKYQTYLWTVFLWDAGSGRYRSYRQHAGPL